MARNQSEGPSEGQGPWRYSAGPGVDYLILGTEETISEGTSALGLLGELGGKYHVINMLGSSLAF